MKNLRLVVGMAVVALVAIAIFSIGNSETATAQQRDGVTLEFSATFDGLKSADEVTQVVLDNLGSSGEDGVRSAGFNVDSFFDIEYEVDFDKRGKPKSTTVDIELIALSLKSSPGEIIDKVGDALSETGKMTRFRGHVTVLK